MPNYQKISNKIDKLIINNPATANKITWLNITNAGTAEIKYLSQAYHFNIAHLRSSTAKVFSQRPMLMNEEKYLFLILHFPIFQNGHIVAGEVEFFVGHGYLITIHNNNIPAINNFFRHAQENPRELACFQADSSAILLAELLDRLLRSCYPIIDENSLAIDKMGGTIFENSRADAISAILRLRHNIVSIRKIIQNHKNIFRKLIDIESSVVRKVEIQNHYSNLLEDSERIWEMLDNQKEMVEALSSTNESLMNARMASIMKTLTIISVITFPLTLIATVFSMNTPGKPWANHPIGFWYVLALMGFTALMMLLFFRRKKWL